MTSMKKLLLIFVMFCTGCAVTPLPPPYVPYTTYSAKPPKLSGRYYTPLTFKCLDRSNIFVIANDSWWWAGPSRGWIPTGGGMFPQPRDIWPNKVFNLPQPIPQPQWKTTSPYDLPPWNQFNNIPGWKDLQFVM